MYNNKNYFITLIPGMFYCFIVFSFIINADPIGFRQPYTIAYPIAGVITVAYAWFVVRCGKKNRSRIESIVLD